MKSYNGLYERMMQLSEIKESIIEASRHKTKRSVVINVLNNIDEKSEMIYTKISAGQWSPPYHQKHTLQEGAHKKVREIIKPRWDDEQIVHHMLVRQLRLIVEPRLYRYAYGSLPGRGTHEAVKVMTHWRNQYGGKRFYVFEGDVRKFYDNIDTEILKKKLHKRIRDTRYLKLMESVIDTTAPGLPKGFYTSPWLANLYMEEFDNFVLQTLKPDYYLRYMDNLFIFHRNKKELHRMVQRIIEFLDDKLSLQLNKNWQVYRFERNNSKCANNVSGKRSNGRAVNALGFIIHGNRISLRKSILKRTRSKANHMFRKHRYTKYDCASLLSRIGYFRHAQVYGYYLRYIKPKVSIQYCKRRISTLSKKYKKG